MAENHRLVLLRHGETDFTHKKLFCGFGNDADLSDLGKEEAMQAGQRLLQNGIAFDIAFTSVLKRAIKTLYLVQEALDCHWLPVVRSWRLNERHYGALQGLSKEDTALKYGEEQVKHMDPDIIPSCESLQDTVTRMLPLWHDEIAPIVKAGKRVLIVAHGNSLRGFIKYLDGLSNDEIIKVEVPQALPLVYELDGNLSPQKSYYLATDEEVKRAKAKIGVKDNIK